MFEKRILFLLGTIEKNCLSWGGSGSCFLLVLWLSRVDPFLFWLTGIGELLFFLSIVQKWVPLFKKISPFFWLFPVALFLEKDFTLFLAVLFFQGLRVAFFSILIAVLRFSSKVMQAISLSEKNQQEINGRLKEITSLMSKSIDQNRLEILGEVSSIVLHDMKGPLQAARFCLMEYRTHFFQKEAEKHIVQLEKSISRLSELLEVLQNYLRNPDKNSSNLSASLFEAHRHTLKLLEIEFHSDFFKNVQFDLSDAVKNVKLRLSQIDLVHILYNVYRNSIQNFILKKIKNPKIQIQIEAGEKDLIKIKIIDNVGGISFGEFENLSNYQLELPSETIHQGVGMRLTKKLIERYQGKFSILQEKEKTEGTLFQLEMRMDNHSLINRSS